jgi:hypothetical protein
MALTFMTVGSLSIVCAYHHGIDDIDQHHQTSTHSTHSTLFCSFLSKLSSQVLIASPAFTQLLSDIVYINPIESNDGLSSLPIRIALARSPPFQSHFSI